MSEDRASKVNACLEQLERAVRELKVAFAEYAGSAPPVEASAPAPAQPAVAPAAAAAAAATAVAATAVAAATTAAPVAAEAPAAAPTPAIKVPSNASLPRAPQPVSEAGQDRSEPVQDLEITFCETEDGDVIITPPTAEHDIKVLLTRVFAAALLETTAQAWLSLEHLTHSEAIYGPRSLEHLRSFNWKKLRKNIDFYIDVPNPGKFRIQRTEPAEYHQLEQVKVFIHHRKGGSPAPIFLQRDAKFNGAWRVYQYGL